MEVDLHIHTLHSDGTYSVSEVIERACKNNLKAIAITDHDTIDGILEKREENKDLEIINGIEISCNVDGLEVHILGYFLDLNDEKFLEEIKNLKISRDERNKKIIDKFKSIGIEIDYEKLKNFAKGNIISRLHFANFLISKNIVKNKDEAFQKYIGKDGICYVPKDDLPPIKAVQILKSNNAFVSLAHPLLIMKNYNKLENLIKELIPYGLDALEANYKSFNKEEIRILKNLAKKYNLFITGGSDFHGDNRIGTDIGDAGISYEILKEIKNNK